mmetsp:Transcript_51118/g.87615  ORF Transcript_51118/g.87615 Transcript_51118/m.87615 type:complete len:272 (+) Transcript_51118:3-818(+)
MDRPVVQEVTSAYLRDQGVRPLDVLVSIKGLKLGDVTAPEAARLLRQAKHEEVNQPFKIGLLHLAPRDQDSSYHVQHPIDVAAALTEYDPESRQGVLSFSLPFAMPTDKFRVEVFRYGSQIAPALGEFGTNDQYVRVTDDGRPLVLTYEEVAERERANETVEEKERRLQRALAGSKWEDPKERASNLLLEKVAKEAKEAAAAKAKGKFTAKEVLQMKKMKGGPKKLLQVREEEEAEEEYEEEDSEKSSENDSDYGDSDGSFEETDLGGKVR